jgi:beta-lactam-binding protein with PASTA domain
VTRTHVALGIAVGFLAGVLLAVALTGGTQTETVTVARTVTVASPSVTTGGTVIVTAPVPAVTGERLDVAKDRIRRAGFDADVDGGGTFGVIKESNWEVVAQDPGPGVALEKGSSVRVRIERR